MKLSISTEVLKELVTRASKGVGNNKLMPITSLMSIKCKDNALTLTVTDATNYLYIIKDKIDCEGFDVVVQAEQFSKLISKLTCDKVEMEVTGNALEVRGNGTYRIDIPLDEGEFIQYPDPVATLELNEDNRYEVHSSSIRTVLESCKSSLAATLEVPCYTGYYCGDSVVTTNDYAMSSCEVNLFGKEVLVAPEFMDLVSLMTEEKFSAYVVDDNIVCTSPDCIVMGRLMEGLEDYPVEGIKNYIAQDMESSCKVNKSEILSVLDRITLFVGPYDEDAIRLTFTHDGLNIESKQLNGVETVSYSASDNFKPFTGIMDVRQLTNLIKSYPDDEVKLHYGSEKALKLTAGNVAFVIAWIVDDTAEEA